MKRTTSERSEENKRENETSQGSQVIPWPDPFPVIPEELKPFLVLLEWPFGLPVCLCCRSAILPRSVMDHLRKQHKLPANLRQAVRTLLSALPSDFDASDLPRRPDNSGPVKELRVVEAFQCKRCLFIRQDLTDVRKHINQEHAASATDGYEPIQAQSWLGGKRAVYWKVDMWSDETVDEGPSCVWGLFGKGWGDKTPRKWPKALAEHSKALV